MITVMFESNCRNLSSFIISLMEDKNKPLIENSAEKHKKFEK